MQLPWVIRLFRHERLLFSIIIQVHTGCHFLRKAGLGPVLENMLLRFPAEARVQEMGRALLERIR